MLQRLKVYQRVPWSQQEIIILREMVREGRTRKEISDSIGRSYHSVKAKIDTEGITKPHRRTPKDCVTMPIRVTQRFHDRYKAFCRIHSSNFGETIEVIMDSFMNQVAEAEDERVNKYRR